MPFAIKQSGTYSWPVKIDVPVDGGTFRTETFDAEFRRLPQDEVDAILKDVMMGEKSQSDFAGEILVGWTGIVDDDKQQIPFSETAKAEVLNVPLAAQSIVSAYLSSIAGAPRKN